jgi:hypothetical protein
MQPPRGHDPPLRLVDRDCISGYDIYFQGLQLLVTVTVTVVTVTRTRRTTDRCPPPEAQTRSTIPARPTGTHTRPLTSQPSPSQAEITQPHTSHSASQTSTPPTSAPHPAPSSCSYPARSTCCGGCYRTPIHTRPQTQGRARPPRRPTSSCPRTCGPNLAHAPNAPLARGSPRCPLPCCTGIVISPCWLPTPRPSSLPPTRSLRPP